MRSPNIRSALLLALVFAPTITAAQVILGKPPAQAPAKAPAARPVREEWANGADDYTFHMQSSAGLNGIPQESGCRVVMPESLLVLNSVRSDSLWVRPVGLYCGSQPVVYLTDGKVVVQNERSGRRVRPDGAVVRAFGIEEVRRMGSGRDVFGYGARWGDDPPLHMMLRTPDGRLDSLTMVERVAQDGQGEWAIVPLTPVVDSVDRVLAQRAAEERRILRAEQVADSVLAARGRASERMFNERERARERALAAQESERQNRLRTAWALLKREGASDEQANGAVRGRLFLGMSADAVRLILGEPTRRAEAVGGFQSWYYLDGRVAHFKDGKIVSLVQ